MIARLESQIEENNIRLRRTRRMVRVVTEHLRSNSSIETEPPTDGATK